MDIVNAYFHRWYPPNVDRRDDRLWRFGDYRHGGWRYEGPEKADRIFPKMLCTDGFQMSVQGHYGAYSFPSSDFSEEPYIYVEVRVPIGDKTLKATWRSFDRQPSNAESFDPWDQYADVPVRVIVALIEAHGGLFDWNAANLCPPEHHPLSAPPL